MLGGDEHQLSDDDDVEKRYGAGDHAAQERAAPQAGAKHPISPSQGHPAEARRRDARQRKVNRELPELRPRRRHRELRQQDSRADGQSECQDCRDRGHGEASQPSVPVVGGSTAQTCTPPPKRSSGALAVRDRPRSWSAAGACGR